MTAGLGRTLTYTSYNMPAQVVGVGYSGGTSTTYNYVYNAEHERTKLVHSTLGSFIYLHPAGKGQLLYEKQTEAGPSTRIEHKYYISAGGASVAVHYARENPNLTETTTATRYLHQDHLGSITLITNEAGGVTERLAYEAYGKRRYPAGTDDPTNGLFGQVTDRGFTSHEHLDEIALIHMNGRVYDPVLGRFVTADPFLQDPSNLQSYNRYSYVLNNPLMYVDPSGYFSFKKLFRIAAAIAVAVVLGPESSYALFSNAFANAAVAGFASGAIATGSLQGGLQGAITGALFFSTVGLTNPGIERIAAHAVVGCATSAASGGNCGAGALAAGFGKFASGALDGIQNEIVRGVIASVIGGTASVLGGGKFENGAVTAAFGYLFNTFTEINAAEGRARAACASGPTMACSEARTALRGAWDKTNREQALESSLGPDDILLAGVGVAVRGVTSGVAVIGHFPQYTRLAERLGAEVFDLGGRFASMNVGQRWAANKAFLDSGIQRGIPFILATDMRPGMSYFRAEVSYLLRNGYEHGTVNGLRALVKSP